MTIETERRGAWMQTYNGRAFYPLDPRADEVDPVDIAHALGMICRYGGHARDFYSVAEHCVLMSYAVDPTAALWALLHDAGEAYVTDLIRPLKYALPDYRAIEDRVMVAVCERFELAGPCPPAVKDADLRILHDEREVLMGHPPMPWMSIEHVQPLGVTIECWTPARASSEYLMRLGELMEQESAVSRADRVERARRVSAGPWLVRNTT